MKSLLILLFILVLMSVTAQSSDVYVLNVHYDNGQMTVTDIVKKPGFFPDRKIQPRGGHTLDMISFDNDILYSFVFDVPTRIFTDGSQRGEMIGGIVVLNETDFSFVVPYYDNVKVIRISDPGDNQITTYAVGPVLSPDSRLAVSVIFAVALLIAAFVYYKKH